MRLALAALAALALAGCATTAEESARLERAAKRSHKTSETQAPLRALVAGRASSKTQVQSTAVLHTREGTAAVVTVRNLTSSRLRKVPILITVRDGSGASLYTNNQPGISSTLTTIPSVPAHGSSTWVDDQVQAVGTPVSVTAKLGEGRTAGDAATLTVTGRLGEENSNGGALEGTVANSDGHSSTGSRRLCHGKPGRAHRLGRARGAHRSAAPWLLPLPGVPDRRSLGGEPAAQRPADGLEPAGTASALGDSARPASGAPGGGVA